MMTEDDRLHLTEALNRLELVSASEGKENLKNWERKCLAAMNPFSYTTCDADFEGETKKLFGPKCDCTKQKMKTLEHTILNRVQFKQKRYTRTNNNRVNNKFILREPILKLVDHCPNYGRVRHKRWNAAVNLEDLPGCPMLEALNLEDSSCTKKEAYIEKENDKLLDFKALVEECDLISSNCLIYPGHRYKTLKSFTTLQPNDIRTSHHSRRLKKSQSKVTNEHSPVVQNATKNSSCSQQARIKTSSTCDVTIDELASYFETFVHIPKKMSTMAEMMYI